MVASRIFNRGEKEDVFHCHPWFQWSDPWCPVRLHAGVGAQEKDGRQAEGREDPSREVAEPPADRDHPGLLW